MTLGEPLARKAWASAMRVCRGSAVRHATHRFLLAVGYGDGGQLHHGVRLLLLLLLLGTGAAPHPARWSPGAAGGRPGRRGIWRAGLAWRKRVRRPSNGPGHRGLGRRVQVGHGLRRAPLRPEPVRPDPTVLRCCQAARHCGGGARGRGTDGTDGGAAAAKALCVMSPRPVCFAHCVPAWNQEMVLRSRRSSLRMAKWCSHGVAADIGQPSQRQQQVGQRSSQPA